MGKLEWTPSVKSLNYKTRILRLYLCFTPALLAEALKALYMNGNDIRDTGVNEECVMIARYYLDHLDSVEEGEGEGDQHQQQGEDSEDVGDNAGALITHHYRIMALTFH